MLVSEFDISEINNKPIFILFHAYPQYTLFMNTVGADKQNIVPYNIFNRMRYGSDVCVNVINDNFVTRSFIDCRFDEDVKRYKEIQYTFPLFSKKKKYEFKSEGFDIYKDEFLNGLCLYTTDKNTSLWIFGRLLKELGSEEYLSLDDIYKKHKDLKNLCFVVYEDINNALVWDSISLEYALFCNLRPTRCKNQIVI